ncbi:MAG: sulfide/dihydroorotate dehydrogenase-like FAD/NAD-binding protein [Halobacteriota archaeon]
MYRIIRKKEIAPLTDMLEIEAPRIARKARAGQFVIVRVDERGERVPLTIAEAYASSGLIKIIFQEVGLTTKKLRCMKEGDELTDLVGPLGTPTEIQRWGTVVLVGGGYGAASLEIIARELKSVGNNVISIVGARSRSFLVQVDEISANSEKLYVTTDDGTQGERGFVVQPLERLLTSSVVDRVLAIGPLPMMRAVADLTRRFEVPTAVSLNPIMVDGTGMCGSCRVTIGGETKFACVDGPEFDAHRVDFDLLAQRLQFYNEEEKEAIERGHACLNGPNGR